ncbi:hypothetical protein Tco_0936717 [Tanacetum coccineum]|uniref:Uncharacterized protein n=1 Tax=Tanacetum coccineum TaxID=301880 RepID=A0ABQ5DD50_9ASTR
MTHASETVIPSRPSLGCDKLGNQGAKYERTRLWQIPLSHHFSDSSMRLVDPVDSTICSVISSAAPVVETTLVASPTGLCGLVSLTGFSDSDSPDE